MVVYCHCWAEVSQEYLATWDCWVRKLIEFDKIVISQKSCSHCSHVWVNFQQALATHILTHILSHMLHMFIIFHHFLLYVHTWHNYFFPPHFESRIKSPWFWDCQSVSPVTASTVFGDGETGPWPGPWHRAGIGVVHVGGSCRNGGAPNQYIVVGGLEPWNFTTFHFIYGKKILHFIYGS